MSETMTYFSDEMARPRSKESLDAKVFARMRKGANGKLFSPRDFLDLGERAAVDQTLSRLSRTEKIRRVGRGLYDIPIQHSLLGELSPGPETIARKLAERDGERIQPTGAAAANLLGLSEQVPARFVYHTDGRPRRIHVGKNIIELRKRTPRQMALTGRLSGLLVSALRWLGKGRVSDAQLEKLRRNLSEKDRKSLLKDLPMAPTWMHPHLRFLAETPAAKK